MHFIKIAIEELKRLEFPKTEREIEYCKLDSLDKVYKMCKKNQITWKTADIHPITNLRLKMLIEK